MAHVSSKEALTRNMSKLQAMNYLGGLVGSLLASALLVFDAFTHVLLAVIIAYAVCLVVTIFCMRESTHSDPSVHPPIYPSVGSNVEQQVTAVSDGSETPEKGSFKSKLVH
jgi:hypothetical protein